MIIKDSTVFKETVLSAIHKHHADYNIPSEQVQFPGSDKVTEVQLYNMVDCILILSTGTIFSSLRGLINPLGIEILFDFTSIRKYSIPVPVDVYLFLSSIKIADRKSVV